MKTYNYIVYLTLIIFIAQPLTSLAQNDRYRVEILVLKHLDHAESPAEELSLTDYSTALDFLAPVEEEAETVCEPEEGLESDPALVAEQQPPPGEAPIDEALVEDDPEAIDPNAVVHVADMGPEMSDAWRRLRLSGPFRPLQYLAWEQGADEPFPLLRVHDAEIVLVDDPYADLREAEAEFVAMYGDTVTGPETDPDPDADESADGCTETDDADELPDPLAFYALDGTASLVRTRFLHLKLDLELREAVYGEPLPTDGEPIHPLVPGGDETAAPVTRRPTSFLVHRLEQSRQVRSGRMEYFDGPVIGVLAWLTTVPLEDAAER